MVLLYRVLSKYQVTNEQGQNCVSARELHRGLEVTERFQHWFDKKVEKYGFVCDEDFTSVKKFTVVNNGAKKELQDFIAATQKKVTAQGNESTYIDYIITVDMAKELCMVRIMTFSL